MASKKRRPVKPKADPKPWKAGRPMGLARALMKAGYGTRKQTTELVKDGRITLDGKKTTDPSTKVEPDTKITLDGKPLAQLKFSYYAFHKPPRVVCTPSDGPGSKLVSDFFPESVIGLHLAGRLDGKTTGLILVSNDRPWLRAVSRAGALEQEFRIQVEGELTDLEIGVMTAGVILPNHGLFRPLSVKVVEVLNNRTVLNLVVGEGKLRMVRRMLTTLRHKIVYVKRIRIGGIRLGDLASGKFRHLTSGEIAEVRNAARVSPRD